LGISLNIVKNFERGSLDARGSVLVALERAVSDAGVVVLDAGDQQGTGPGVRFRAR
jgi:hypothetical protein